MFDFFNKDEDEPVISFVSTVPSLLDIERALPRKMNQDIPSWWKKLLGYLRIVKINLL